jgi:hypothetical protein
MSAFGTPALLGGFVSHGGHKVRRFTVAGTASYDTGGSVIDLSTTTLGLDNGFTVVHGVSVLGVAAAASDRYQPVYVRASAGAAATGKLKVRDADDATAMSEVGSTDDLSTHTFIIEVTGV